MDKEKIERINYLARKSKGEGLTSEEKEEQAELRALYLADFRTHFRAQLENIEFVNEKEDLK